ncbi:MAG: ATP-binding protein [Planctomycetota bacterium]
MKTKNSPSRSTAAVGKSLLDVGEASVASTGLVLAIVLLCGMVLSGWLVQSSNRTALAETQRHEATATADTISIALEHALAADDLALVRRLLASVAAELDLETCRLSLPTGGVLADRDATAITVHAFPDDWPAATTSPDTIQQTEQRVDVTRQVQIAQRGQATLHIAMPVSTPSGAFAQIQTTIGGIGAITMLVLLLLYRRLRHRIRAISAIRESLLALQQGETEEAALQISTTLGKEAEAWNELLTEKASLRREQIRQRAIDRFEESSRDGGESLADACNAMRMGLMIVDGELNVQYINGAAAVLMQTTVDAAAGNDLTSIVRDEDVLALVRSTFGKRLGTSSQAELNRAHDTGDVIRADIRLVNYRGDNHALIALEDITQFRLAEESRNALIAQATHELRTPLTNIRMYVETAIEDGDRDPEVRGQCLNVINHEASRLERIVGDMLSVAEIEAGGVELVINDIRLDNLFAELENDYAAAARDSGIDLKFDMIPRLPKIKGDRDKLTLVFHNLLGNALKYTLDAGTVTVKVDATETELLVDVTDTGIGIAAEDQDRIFEKFQRARDSRLDSIGGTGLGLALAHEVVQRHGGSLTVDSQINVGSTFHVVLPLGTDEGQTP